jgi:D-3-phosphoglycerate dehydrogenase
LGNIGRELLALARPFGMRHLATDPYVRRRAVEDADVTLVDLDELLSAADVVCLTCPLTPETYRLIDAARLARMKPDAVLVNVARGGLVDQGALVDALRTGTIRAAALDTLDPEPPAEDDPILSLDNVVLAPHSIAWTTELAHGNTAACCRAILDLMAGRAPRHVVNPAVLASTSLRDKLAHNGIVRASSHPEVTR